MYGEHERGLETHSESNEKKFQEKIRRWGMYWRSLPDGPEEQSRSDASRKGPCHH